MAYNFPVNYQPYYPTYQTQNQSNSIIWVQGEAGAKSYLVAPNTTVQLWDSEQNVIYLKSADASGMPSIKILDYTIRQEAPKTPVDALKTETKGNPYQDEFNALQGQIDALKREIEELKGNEQ